MRQRLHVILVLVSVTLSGVRADTSRLEVRRSVDRTAVFVGDHVRYTLEFTTSGDLDVLAEDVARDRLPIKGGDVIGHESVERSTANGRVRRVQFTMVSYAAGTPEIVIEPFEVRYYSRRTVGETQAPPSGQVVVPRTAIPIRSTLPDSGRLPELREPQTLTAVPRYLELARPLGIGLIALVAVPVLAIVFNVAGHLRRVRAAAPRGRARRALGELLDELAARHPTSRPEHVDAFEQLDGLVRDHVEAATSIPARALTPAEIGQALRVRPRGRDAAQTIESLLTRCEMARYGPEAPTPATWRDALAAAEDILRSRKL
jgi:hypothetical protein